MYSGKVVVIGQKWLYFCKMVFFGQSDCIRIKVVIPAKVVVFGQNGFIVVKVVVF